MYAQVRRRQETTACSIFFFYFVRSALPSIRRPVIVFGALHKPTKCILAATEHRPRTTATVHPALRPSTYTSGSTSSVFLSIRSNTPSSLSSPIGLYVLSSFHSSFVPNFHPSFRPFVRPFAGPFANSLALSLVLSLS